MESRERFPRRLDRTRAALPLVGQVLCQGARINENRWKEVAAQTGDPEVAWALSNLSRPITHPGPKGIEVEAGKSSSPLWAVVDRTLNSIFTELERPGL
jgi:hypothetical protein